MQKHYKEGEKSADAPIDKIKMWKYKEKSQFISEIYTFIDLGPQFKLEINSFLLAIHTEGWIYRYFSVYYIHSIFLNIYRH